LKETTGAVPSCGKIEVKAGNARAKSLKTLASGVSDVVVSKSKRVF